MMQNKNYGKSGNNEMNEYNKKNDEINKNKKVIAWIRAIRPQFLIAYIILGIGGIAIGVIQPENTINIGNTVLSFITIILAAIGIHYRDEASDWIEGYDREHGGVGVIREGILEAKPLQNVGRLLNIIAFIVSGIQIYLEPQLLYIILPVIIIIIGSNYLTEKIFLGHELAPAIAYSFCILWVYLAEGWIIIIPVIWFTIFAFLLVFSLVPYQDIGDYEADKKSGKITLTVKLGIDPIGHICIGIALISLIPLYITLITIVPFIR